MSKIDEAGIAGGNKDIVGGFGGGFAFREGERQVGETAENPSIPG